MRDAFFRRLKRPIWLAVYRTTGRRLPASVDYRDFTAIRGDFDADARVARRLVPSAFDVVESSPGRTTVGVAAMSYREVDIMAPYGEFVVQVPVEYHDRAGETTEGVFPISVPVTTEDARWGGVEIAGFPKFVADVAFESTPEGFSGTLTKDGEHVLTLAVDVEDLSPERDEELVRLFNVRRDGHVTESTFERVGTSDASDRPGGARLELGTHPLSNLLRALDVGTESVGHEFTPAASGHLRTPSVDHGPIERERGAPSRLVRALRRRIAQR